MAAALFAAFSLSDHIQWPSVWNAMLEQRAQRIENVIGQYR
jgi:hypothetical protein